MDVSNTSAAAEVPPPGSSGETEQDRLTKTIGTCSQLVKHMHDWVDQMQTCLEAGDIQRLLALSAALGENNAYLAGIADKAVRC